MSGGQANVRSLGSIFPAPNYTFVFPLVRILGLSASLTVLAMGAW